MLVWPGEEDKREGLVVGVDIEVMAFYDVLEMFDGQVNSQQLTVKCAVTRLCWC